MSDAIEFVDAASIHVTGGRGGNGAASFRRESHVPRGGPDGGDGGRGGNVVLVADRRAASLLDVHRAPHRKGGDGGHGSSQRKTGKDGADTVVRVPVGTVVRTREGRVIADLTAHGDHVVASRGGRGGRGNASFANAQRRVPRFAEYGEKVGQVTLRLDLKVIADVGLVGYPSAGKSSLVGHLSAAKPRVAAWPFTTLTPHLGVMRAGNAPDGTPIDVVLADVPGLVEGASEGKGLGHRFLRHVERCRVLLHVLDTTPFDHDRDPVRDLAVIRAELVAHDPALAQRTEVVALNKVDVPDGRAMAELTRQQLQDQGWEVFEISAVTGEGLDPLRYRLGELVARARASDEVELASDDGVLITLRPSDEGFSVARGDDGSFIVTGDRVQRWIQMLPIDNPDALRYLQGRLRRAGVDKALVDAGARGGDDVVIGDAIFDFEPEIDDLPEEERLAILAAEFDDDDDDGEAVRAAIGAGGWHEPVADEAGLDGADTQ